MVKEFYFYLDAWWYCKEHKIKPSTIQRYDWRRWIVVIPTKRKKPNAKRV